MAEELIGNLGYETPQSDTVSKTPRMRSHRK